MNDGVNDQQTGF